MEQKLISVIIPVYNVAEYLPRCLESIIHNSYDCLEIICINDGSTDKSLNVLEQYAEKDNRICLLSQSNGGVAAARNAGLRIARGDYIAFVDPDDYVHKDYFLFLYRAILEEQAGIAICDYIQTSENSALDGDKRYLTRTMTVEEMSSNHNTKTYIWKRLYDAKIIGDTFFDEKVSVEDSVFNLDILVKNDNLSIVYVDAKLYAYFVRQGSLVSTFDSASFLELSEIFLEYCKREKRKSLASIFAEDAIKKALAARYISILVKDKKNVESANNIIKKSIPYIQKGKYKYRVFQFLPALYRIFRIVNDRSMLDYENKLRSQLR